MEYQDTYATGWSQVVAPLRERRRTLIRRRVEALRLRHSMELLLEGEGGDPAIGEGALQVIGVTERANLRELTAIREALMLLRPEPVRGGVAGRRPSARGRSSRTSARK
jgi:hypothetical protein